MASSGKVVMDSVIETKATTILEFIHGLEDNLWVTFEKDTSAAWLYDRIESSHIELRVYFDSEISLATLESLSTGSIKTTWEAFKIIRSGPCASWPRRISTYVLSPSSLFWAGCT